MLNTEAVIEITDIENDSDIFAQCQIVFIHLLSKNRNLPAVPLYQIHNAVDNG